MLLAVTQNNPKERTGVSGCLFNDKQVDGVIFAATILTAEHKRALKKLSVPVILGRAAVLPVIAAYIMMIIMLPET